MSKKPLVFVALSLCGALGFREWIFALEKRSELPRRLHFSVRQGNFSVVKFTPPLTDAFTVSMGDLSQYRRGYEHENWKVTQLRFRASSQQVWKPLSEKVWRGDWHFLRLRSYDPFTDGKQQRLYSMFDYSRQRELFVGQYEMRAILNEEFHDNTSGVQFFGTPHFKFVFHVNPAPKWKKQVVLDELKITG